MLKSEMPDHSTMSPHQSTRTPGTGALMNPSTMSPTHGTTPSNNECEAAPDFPEYAETQTPIPPENFGYHQAYQSLQTPVQYHYRCDNFFCCCIRPPFTSSSSSTYNPPQNHTTSHPQVISSEAPYPHDLPGILNTSASSIPYISPELQMETAHQNAIPLPYRYDWEPVQRMKGESLTVCEEEPGERLSKKCQCRSCTISPMYSLDGKRLHVCYVGDCQKTYGKTSHLKAHLRWHTGERPFACAWIGCGKRFIRSDELQRHVRTHTGEKKYQCDKCDKRFMRSDHRNKHAKTHDNQRTRPGNTAVAYVDHEELEDHEFPTPLGHVSGTLRKILFEQ